MIMIRTLLSCRSALRVLQINLQKPPYTVNLGQGHIYVTQHTALYSSETKGLTDKHAKADENSQDGFNKKIPNVEELFRLEQGEPVPLYGHRCNDYDRFCLVYLGKFPSMSSVPAVVPIEQLKLCHDLMRIRYNVWTIIGFTIVSIITKIYYSSQSKKRHEARKKRKETLYNEYMK